MLLFYPTQLFHFKLSAFYRSEAEERLFLFIKLNLTSQEAAAMLRISVDGVKKTRNRLRKRLGLGEDVVGMNI